MKETADYSKLLHLYRRAGLGSLPPREVPLRKAVASLFQISESFTPIEVISAAEVARQRQETRQTMMAGADPKATVKDRLKENQELTRDLNVAWINQMATSQEALRERMALFWHGHFACRIQQQPYLVQNYLHTLRRHALGHFGDLLMAVSKEPAMLQFLNNQQNRKNSPNENFAREVMELFTLGRGHYTEKDIQEAARAFTGWRYSPEGTFVFQERLHDPGSKTFLGRTGTFRGEDIIQILLEEKQTARYLTEKLYRSFVNEVPHPARIDALAEGFYRSGYDIGKLMRTIFEADWFYDESNRASLIKSPVELLVGMQRTLSTTVTDKQSLLYVQKVLGQVLLYPPNVAGWPGGYNWIDSSSLLFRMQLPFMLAGTLESKVQSKNDGDVNTQALNRRGRSLKATIDWDRWAQTFQKVPPKELPTVVASRLLAVLPAAGVLTDITQKAGAYTDRTAQIRYLTLAFMSLPEYQVG